MNARRREATEAIQWWERAGLPWMPVAVAVMLGTFVGGSVHLEGNSGINGARVWLIITSVMLLPGLGLWWKGRQRAAMGVGLVVLMLTTAGWSAARLRQMPEDSVRQWLGQASQLAKVRGVIVDRPVISSAHRGAFAQFGGWESPRTFFVLKLDALESHGQWLRCRGKLLVRLDKGVTGLRQGEWVEVTGWLAGFEGPLNPGEYDRRKGFMQQGIDGRMSAGGIENVRRMGNAEPMSRVLGHGAEVRRVAAMGAAWSLRLGLKDESPETRAMLEALLLGKRGWDLALLEDSFRQTGLIHLLSISGAHLGILLLLTTVVAWRAVSWPGHVNGVVLGVLGAYLLVLPMQVPIVRTAIMAVCLCVGWNSGRRVGGLSMVSLACVLVLWWRPGELWNPGFQLSYGLTAGLIAFTRPVSRWLQGRDEWSQIQTGPPTWLDRVKWWGCGIMAVNLVSFGLALPVVAYHFGLVSWGAMVWSIMALPMVTAVIGLGFLKMVVGLIWPSLGMLLAKPVAWSAQGLIELVEWGAGWRWASWQLIEPVSLGWTITSLLVLVTIGLGWWQGRRRWVVMVMLGLGMWLAGEQWFGRVMAWMDREQAQNNVTVHMLAVGEGSCVVVRIPNDADADGEFVLMFDCGSSAYLDVGMTTIGPVMKKLGVRAIDVLMISHVDLDHLSGTIDLSDQVEVKKVMVTPQFMQVVKEEPRGPAGFMVREFAKRGVVLEVVSQGWKRTVAQSELELIWPPGERVFARSNDTSMVLSVKVGGKRLLLNGDIAEEAKKGLLESGVELQAQLTDLPHHGSFAKSSLVWLDAVRPRVVLQSSGPGRLMDDRWAGPLEERGIERLITQRDGMVTLVISADEKRGLQWETFRKR